MEMEEEENNEEQFRAYLKDFSKWMGKAWEDSGTLGRVWICLLFMGMAAPFAFELLAVFIILFWVWPLSVNLYERLAILGFLFVLFEAMALRIAHYSAGTIFASYSLRRTRRKRKSPPQDSSE